VFWFCGSSGALLSVGFFSVEGSLLGAAKLFAVLCNVGGALLGGLLSRCEWGSAGGVVPAGGVFVWFGGKFFSVVF